MTEGPAFELFEHQADIGVRGYGASVAEAFARTALAMTAVVTDPDAVVPSEPVTLRCRAPDRELLLVDWLNALIFQMATRRMLFSRFEVRIDGQDLQATAWGEPVDMKRHQPAVEIKGATYTELAVRREADGRWLAQCVVDV